MEKLNVVVCESRDALCCVTLLNLQPVDYLYLLNYLHMQRGPASVKLLFSIHNPNILSQSLKCL